MTSVPTQLLPTVPELAPIIPEMNAVYPYNIALIIDNVVYSTFNVEGQQAAQFLSQPKFVQFDNFDARIGWIYNEADGTFSAPEIVTPPEHTGV